MAASTTLMTFMVRTPSSTRSVQLYGSWDNFTTPYPMRRDLRLGTEHWSGCHSFENIICDGRVDGRILPRNGGLKMGGTYWYYYKLDDELEFHNSAEPSTTRCPLLPGQLVNELEVPFSLSGDRKRNASISSTSSERRTLDPEAKFVNPQLAETPPKMLRLSTSPKLPKVSVAATAVRNDSASAEPDVDVNREDRFRVASTRVFHLPRKPSLDALLRCSSRRDNPASLRPEFAAPGIGSTNQSAKYQDIVNWIPDGPKHMQQQVVTEIKPKTAIQRPPNRAAGGGLLLRSNSDEMVPLSSFGAHRRQHSRSRSLERSARRTPTLDETPQLDLNVGRVVAQAPLSALIEVNTPDRTPAYGPMTGRRITLDALEGRTEMDTRIEKRLPTLPNTPSSAYPPTTSAKTPPRKMTSRIAELSSRFSSTTIDTTSHFNSMIMDDDYNNQILGLTTVASPCSSSESTFDDSNSSFDADEAHSDPFLAPLSSHTSLMDELAEYDGYLRPRVMSAALSCTTISSSTSTTPTTSFGEAETIGSTRTSHATTIRSSAASHNHLQHYSLPEVENASAVTLKRYDPNECSLVESNRIQADHRGGLAHSETMQQLLDELSYLSAMIQQ